MATQIRRPPECHLDDIESLVKVQMKNNEVMQMVLQTQNMILDHSMRRIQEMRSCLRQRQYADENPGQEAAGQAQSREEGTSLTHKLQFHGSLKPRIYKNKPLLEQSDETIEIAIYRDGQIITSGHLSSVTVEIVALESNHSCHGYWTEDDFHNKILKRRAGPGSVLEGDCLVKLVNGKAALGNIQFVEGTYNREFILAARVDTKENIGGLRVEEAFMERPVTVLVERSEANEKSVLPKLNDKVHRLKEIAKGGVYSRRLEQDGVYTVQDLLKALNKDEHTLRQTVNMKSNKSWEVMVGHARECDLTGEHQLKSYMVVGGDVSLFFNCVHDIVGAEFNGLYIAKDKFNVAQKALVDSLKEQAYNELGDIGLDYVIVDNRPVKFSANVNAAGSLSIPMSGALAQNTTDHPAGIFAGPSSSALSPPDHRNTHLNQEGDAAILPSTARADMDADTLWATYRGSDTLDWPIQSPADFSNDIGSGDLMSESDVQYLTMLYPAPENPLSPDGNFFGGGGN